MSRTFDGGWWSVVIPDTWQATPEKHGATFIAMPQVGTLQISAAKHQAGPISDEDLFEFAAERVSAGYELKKCAYESFSGLTCRHVEDDLRWNEWWLRSGRLLVYATYIRPLDVSDREESKLVAQILGSLQAREP
jgi:hypothetical protein